jgi:replicative DNA helicase
VDENNNKGNLFNLEAEQIILGLIISNNDYLGKVEDVLKVEHFYETAHQKIYEYIRNTVLRSNIVADSVTLKLFFDSDALIRKIGGSDYIITLVKTASATVDAFSYANLIKDLFIKRRLVLIGESMVSDIYKDVEQLNSSLLIEEVESKLYELNTKDSLGKGFVNFSDTLQQTLDKVKSAMSKDGVSGISTGYVDVDNVLGGIQNSDLIIIAGATSMGKTAFAINLAYNVAKKFIDNEKSVGIFSLEMSTEQIGERILALETGISVKNFRNGHIQDSELEKLALASKEIEKLPIYIDDTPALSISTIRTRTRRLINKHKLGFLIVDYLQLAKGNLTRQSKESRVIEIAEITRGLKAIAKEFDIPVIALAQVSRSVDSTNRETKRPELQDLRESGSIEQDADVVMFVYRQEYYEKRKKPDESEQDKMRKWQEKMNEVANKAEIIIAKNRHGPTGYPKLFFNELTGKFENSGGDYDRAEKR